MSGNFRYVVFLTSFSPLDDDIKIGNNEKPPGHRSPFSALFLSLPFCGKMRYYVCIPGGIGMRTVGAGGGRRERRGGIGGGGGSV